MEFARCTQNDLIYNAEQFSGLPTQDLSEKRRYLVCPECSGHAFFRKETRNDREACFGARPHAEGCHLKAADAAANSNGQADAYGPLMQPAQRLVVDFGYGAPAQGNQQVQASAIDNCRAPDEPATSSGCRTNHVQHVRLRPLLRMLTSPTPCQTLPHLVDVAGFGKFAVADFFVSFKAAAPMHDYKLHGFFGQVAYAQFDQANTLWLNAGGRSNLSICIPHQHVAELYSRFGISDQEAFAGASVLVLGTLQISPPGKRYVVLEDLSHITVHLERGALM
jgi:hypothetical protein